MWDLGDEMKFVYFLEIQNSDKLVFQKTDSMHWKWFPFLFWYKSIQGLNKYEEDTPCIEPKSLL